MLGLLGGKFCVYAKKTMLFSIDEKENETKTRTSKSEG